MAEHPRRNDKQTEGGKTSNVGATTTNVGELPQTIKPQEPPKEPEPANPPSVTAESTAPKQRRKMVSLRPAVEALTECTEALEKLEAHDRRRVLAWLKDEYGDTGPLNALPSEIRNS